MWRPSGDPQAFADRCRTAGVTWRAMTDRPPSVSGELIDQDALKAVVRDALDTDEFRQIVATKVDRLVDSIRQGMPTKTLRFDSDQPITEPVEQAIRDALGPDRSREFPQNADARQTVQHEIEYAIRREIYRAQLGTDLCLSLGGCIVTV